ncbi:unnamed protein product [Camellia sinensis]
MAKNENFQETENHMDDDMIRDFPPDFETNCYGSAESVTLAGFFGVEKTTLANVLLLCLPSLEKYETLEAIQKMLNMICSTHYLSLAQNWSSCRLCNVVFKKYEIHYRKGHMSAFLDACALQHLRKG